MPTNGSVAFSLPSGIAIDPPYQNIWSWKTLATRNGPTYYFLWASGSIAFIPTSERGPLLCVGDFATSTPSLSSAFNLPPLDNTDYLVDVNYMADSNGLLWNAVSPDGYIGASALTLVAWDTSGTQQFFIPFSSVGSNWSITTFQDNNIPYSASLIFVATPVGPHFQMDWYVYLHELNGGSFVSSAALASGVIGPSLGGPNAMFKYVLSDGIGFIYAVATFNNPPTDAVLYKIDILTGTVLATLDLLGGGSVPGSMIMNRANGQILMTYPTSSTVADIHIIDSITMLDVGSIPGLSIAGGSVTPDIPLFPLNHHDSINGPAVDCPRGEFGIASPWTGSFPDINRIGLQTSNPLLQVVDTVVSKGDQDIITGNAGFNGWGLAVGNLVWNPYFEGWVANNPAGGGDPGGNGLLGASLLYTPYVTGSCGNAPCTGVTTEFR